MTLTNILIAAELFLLLQFLNPLPDLNLGNAAGIAFSAAAILLTLYPRTFPLLTAAFVIMAVIIAAAGAVLTRLIFSAAGNAPPAGEPVTLIVLGCRVKGQQPSNMLRRRLKTAIAFLEREPKAVCIVSGGQGSDEQFTEALVMKNYLLSHGVSPERVIMEDRASTTAENLAFSKDIIEKRGLPETIALATDAFHQYRSAMLAKRVGILPYAVSAPTEPRYVLTYIVREYLAIIAYSTLK